MAESAAFSNIVLSNQKSSMWTMTNQSASPLTYELVNFSSAGEEDVTWSGNATIASVTESIMARPPNYYVLALLGVIFASTVGNVLVCLAVCWEKRLQNMTNYFLMSLAIADLLVSILVMPLGMVVEMYGKSYLTLTFHFLCIIVDY